MSWKILAIAAISLIAGTTIGYFLTGLAYRRLKKQYKALKDGKFLKKMGAMDKILILEAVILIAYTIADLVVFWHTGNEPATLTTCVFGVCGIENGVMGWIKTNKDKINSGSSSDSEYIEPPDAGA